MKRGSPPKRERRMKVGAQTPSAPVKNVVRMPASVIQAAAGPAPLARRQANAALRTGARLAPPRRRIGLVDEQDQHRQHQPGDADHQEGGAPAEPGRDQAAGDQADGGAQHHAELEDAEDAGAQRGVEAVADEGAGRRRVGGLADADGGAGDEDLGEGRRQPGERGGDAPQPDAHGDEPLAQVAIGEIAERDRRHRVHDHEGGRQPADLRRGEAEPQVLVLQERVEGADDVAIDVVQEVDQREDDQQRGRRDDAPASRDFRRRRRNNHVVVAGGGRQHPGTMSNARHPVKPRPAAAT
jgi:hypothetical protein